MRQVKYGQGQRGFTLIELVVVIGIILLLLGLVMAVGTSVRQGGERQQTETTVQLLDMAVQEWETTSARKLTWGINDDPVDGAFYDIQGDPQGENVNGATWDILVITEVLKTIRKPSGVQSIIAQIDPDFVYRYHQNDRSTWLSPTEVTAVNDGFVEELTVLDAWGLPIYATLPGRLPFQQDFDNNLTIDADGTIQTFNENWYGVAKNRRVCFVSAGPDGDFGQMNPPGNDPDLLAATEDNVFSYEAISPRDYP